MKVVLTLKEQFEEFKERIAREEVKKDIDKEAI